MPAKNASHDARAPYRGCHQKFFLRSQGIPAAAAGAAEGEAGSVRGDEGLCWLLQHSPLRQTRRALPNGAGQHCRRNGFYSRLPWWWSDQTANETSDGAGDIITYAAGRVWENNAVYQVSAYQSSSSWFVRKVAKGSSKLGSFTCVENRIFFTLCELILDSNAICSIIIAFYLLFQILYYSINY